MSSVSSQVENVRYADKIARKYVKLCRIPVVCLDNSHFFFFFGASFQKQKQELERQEMKLTVELNKFQEDYCSFLTIFICIQKAFISFISGGEIKYI